VKGAEGLGNRHIHEILHRHIIDLSSRVSRQHPHVTLSAGSSSEAVAISSRPTLCALFKKHEQNGRHERFRNVADALMHRCDYLLACH
jgi:hypothetical protein